LYKYYKDNLKVSKPLDGEIGLYDMGDVLSIDKQFKTMETDSRPVWMILFLDKVSESEVKSVKEFVYLLKE
jgi:hypothetical protein